DWNGITFGREASDADSTSIRSNNVLTIGDHAGAAVGILTFLMPILGRECPVRVCSRSREQAGSPSRGPRSRPSLAAEDQAIEFTRGFGQVAKPGIPPLQQTGSPFALLVDFLQGHLLLLSEGRPERGSQAALGRGGLLLP